MEPASKERSRLRRWLLVALAVPLVIATLLMFSLASCACSTLTAFDPVHPFDLSHLRDHSKPRWYVAHALGEIDGICYTDSRDAFLLNYGKGYRTFEVDLVLLKDGSVFCAHDGAEWMYGLDKTFSETTADELTGRLCLGKYTPLTGSQLLDLMYEYRDALFILDTKRTTEGSNHEILRSLVSEAKQTHPSVLGRMIPHTFGPADLWAAADIYPFRQYWVAVYSLRCNVDGKSGDEPDRIVLYAITKGGPAAFRRRPGIAEVAGVLCDFPGFGLVSSLCDTALYVSVDIIDTNQCNPTP